MSTLETRKIEPLSGTTVTLGAAGDAVTMPAGVTVKTNTVKDAGGNTIWTSNGSGTLSSVNSGLTGGMNFISSQTASASASVTFTSGIDSTYDEYVFMLVNMHPVTDQVDFGFQVNASGQSGYNETITSTFFHTEHDEAGSYPSGPTYSTGLDQAQGTAYQQLSFNTGNDNDQSMAGTLHLFNPASTTYVKHFYSRCSHVHALDYEHETYTSGYINTTAAITDISFKFESGNIDAGVIYLYGI